MEELRLYENLLIISPSVNDEEAKKIVETYREMIVGEGGEVLFADIWGKKKLCYEIRKFKKAYYGLLQFKLNSVSLKEVERKMKLDENILRYLTTLIKPNMLIGEGEPIVFEEDKPRYGENRNFPYGERF